MDSNTPNLGDDMQPEEAMPDTEQTPAESQDQAVLPADATPADSLDSSDSVAPEGDATDDQADDVAAVAETAAVAATAAVAETAAVSEAAASDAPDDGAPDDGYDEYDGEGHDDQADEDDEDDDSDEDSPDDGPRYRRGQIVDGTVRETSPTEVLVDLDDGVVGVVASRELERMDREALEALEPGNPVRAYVLKARGADGNPVLSLARAEEESNWQLAQEHFDNQDVYFSKVAGYNKGGLIVRFGKVRGFVPASQVSRERQQRASGGSPEERWGRMVGDDIAVKVVEIDRGRNRLILSERAAAREWRERQKERLLRELTVGEVRKGRVISLADFGAFVDLGGADGLVHLTELSWKHVTHPSEVLSVGDEVEVQVINVDSARKRIGLSMKRQEDDPWQQVVKQFSVGQLVQASVTKLTKFGAFARLLDAPEIEGLIHISELADYRVNHPRDVVLVGDVLTLRIVKIEPNDRRLGLSLRQVDSARYMDQDWQFLNDDVIAEDADDTNDADEADRAGDDAEDEVAALAASAAAVDAAADTAESEAEAESELDAEPEAAGAADADDADDADETDETDSAATDEDGANDEGADDESVPEADPEVDPVEDDA